MAVAVSLLSCTAVIGPAPGDRLTAGFTPVSLRESQFVVQRPYDVPLRERYKLGADGVRRMWVYSADRPISATHPDGARTEIKCNEIYNSGEWQFEGKLYVPAGTSGASIVQIFGAAPERRQVTTLVLHVYDGRLTYYHELARVLADGVYGRWIRLNTTVFVDGVERLRARGHGGESHYFKFGVYK